MVNIQRGQMLKQESLKVQFLDRYADDTSLFSVIRNKHLSAQNLNEDLNKINHWAFQWKMSFNPDPRNKLRKLSSLVGSKNRFILHYILIILQ